MDETFTLREPDPNRAWKYRLIALGWGAAALVVWLIVSGRPPGSWRLLWLAALGAGFEAFVALQRSEDARRGITIDASPVGLMVHRALAWADSTRWRRRFGWDALAGFAIEDAGDQHPVVIWIIETTGKHWEIRGPFDVSADRCVEWLDQMARHHRPRWHES